MNLIEPPLDRTFIHDSYACRRGKGVHAAVDRYQGWARRNAYALKMDVARYFPSIDHEILKEKLRRRIKDARVLALLDRIIDTSPPVEEPPVYFPGDDLLTPLERRRGIPIGNLTSQFLANLYLDDLDHYVKQRAWGQGLSALRRRHGRARRRQGAPGRGAGGGAGAAGRGPSAAAPAQGPHQPDAAMGSTCSAIWCFPTTGACATTTGTASAAGCAGSPVPTPRA